MECHANAMYVMLYNTCKCSMEDKECQNKNIHTFYVLYFHFMLVITASNWKKRLPVQSELRDRSMVWQPFHIRSVKCELASLRDTVLIVHLVTFLIDCVHCAAVSYTKRHLEGLSNHRPTPKLRLDRWLFVVLAWTHKLLPCVSSLQLMTTICVMADLWCPLLDNTTDLQPGTI